MGLFTPNPIAIWLIGNRKASCIKIPACAYRWDKSLLILSFFSTHSLGGRHAEFILQVEIVFSIAL